MTRGKIRFRDGEMGSALAVKIESKSHNNELVKILDDGTLLIHLRAPLAKEEMNKELKLFLANILDIADTKIEIVAGEDGVNKLVAILGVRAEEIEKQVMNYL